MVFSVICLGTVLNDIKKIGDRIEDCMCETKAFRKYEKPFKRESMH